MICYKLPEIRMQDRGLRRYSLVLVRGLFGLASTVSFNFAILENK